MEVYDPREKEDISVSEKLYENRKLFAKQFPYLQRSRAFLKQLNEGELDVPIEKLNIARDELFLGFKSLEYSKENVVAPKLSIISDEGGQLRSKPRNEGE